MKPLVNPEGSDPPNVVSSLQSPASKNSETKAQKDIYLSNQWSSESYVTIVDIYNYSTLLTTREGIAYAMKRCEMSLRALCVHTALF